MGDSMASTSSVLNPLSFTSSQTVPVQPSNLASPDVEGAKWDAFLSFRGPDTKKKFTNHLYHDLKLYGLDTTFKDEPELQIGEVISEGLEAAIEDSKTYVVVFSKDYATSAWCLDELAQIYKCYEQKKRLVIGVYYGIDPSVVRHELESFKDSFDKHVKGRYKNQPDRVKEWRRALTGVASFSGLTISGEHGVEVDNVMIIKEIARVIWQHVKPKSVHVADHFVAREILEVIKYKMAKKMAKTLGETVKDVIKIGLHGFGGVGKTTLAKALYNHLLEIIDVKTTCCFLADVRETFWNPNKGLVSLQNQLISAFFKSTTIDNKVYNADEGTEFIKTRFGKTKVLLLIDDVDEFEQCKSLMGPYAPGSVVIITTRNTTTLDDIEVKPTHRFKIEVMKHAESLVLFTAHAFPNAKPDKALMDMFGNNILSLADNLPLALRVFGSHLSKKCKAEWKDYINKLKLNPDNTIRDRLMISLDAMDDLTLKNIFMDIACFFIGMKINDVVHMMEKYYSFDVLHNIRTLEKKSLLTINLNHEMEMHDLLRDMGWEAARNKFPRHELENHTRLWVLDDIRDVLEQDRGGKAIEGIIPSNFYYGNALKDLQIRAETFKIMSNLRFLFIKDVELTGRFEQIFGSLKWLRWECCPLKELPSHFRPRKLVVLELLGSSIIKWELIRDFEYLKTLDMSNSLDLTTLPDFSKLPQLETLNLVGCISLKMFNILDGWLTKLVSLNLRGCVNLGSICDSHCSLKALEVLDVTECQKLKSLPDNLWDIASFQKLSIQKLSTGYNTHFKSPFERLYMNWSSLTILPSSLSQLLNLVDICIINHNLVFIEQLPPNLKTLELSWGKSLISLPDLSNFKHLVDLRVEYSPNVVSIEHLPPNLEQLHLRGCTGLKRLPNLSNFKRLKELSTTHCNGLKEIIGLEEIINSLQVLYCNSSHVAYSSLRRIFQNHLEKAIAIYVDELPDWIDCFDGDNNNADVLVPYVPHNYLGLILCLSFDDDKCDYIRTLTSGVPWESVTNVTTGDTYWIGLPDEEDERLMMLLIPRSIIPVSGGDKIEISGDGDIRRFRLLYDD